MCGIVGYAGFNKRISLEKAVDSIKHRGPDSSGIEYFSKDGVALGNTRLSIIDLSSKGKQPMFSKDKSLCITFNGEIYNYPEVKKLLDHKYKFHSGSDTEVVLYAYKEWGPKFLEKINGMFSFVIYDRNKNLIFGARDRLGQKPLKYYLKNKELIFSSEIKSIFEILQSKPALDETAIDNYLTLQYVPSPQTGYKNIYKLPPAHYFIFQNGNFRKYKYWHLDFSKKLNLSQEEWENLIYKQIKASTKSHMISDVPVGALLSGGLDSSIVVALMTQFSKQKINTFSIGFDDDHFDESKYSKIVSQMYSTNHTALKLTSTDLLKNIENLADYYDEPIADNSILPTLLVSRLASTKVKVALTGDGGDENFAGYERYNFVKIAQYLNILPENIKNLTNKASGKIYDMHSNKLTERSNRFFKTLNLNFPQKYQHYNSFFSNQEKRSLYIDSFNKIVRKNNSFEIFSNIYDPQLDDIDNALNIDINTYLPDDLLYKTDIASMSTALELRSPFLDHELMEKVAKMPSKFKLSNGIKKKILKEVAIKYNLLPKEIVYRKKRGFNIPQNKWFKGPLKSFLYETILSSKMTDLIFKKNKLEKYLDNYFNSNLNYDNNIFALMMLAQWINKYN